MKKRNRITGSALLISIMTVLLVLGMASTYLMASMSRNRNLTAKNENVTAYYAAEAGVEMGIAAVWENYLTSVGGSPGSPTQFRAFLDGIGLADGQTLQAVNNLPYGLATVDSVTVRRTDSADGATTSLMVLSSASYGRRGLKTIQHTVSIEGGLFKGFEFALLGNNINCIMCHAEIDTVERYNNADPAKYGTFDRVKIGSLESMLIRATSAESHIAGTLYTRGTLMNKDGTTLASLSGTTLQGYQLDTDGKVVQDAFGNMTGVDLLEGGVDGSGDPLPNQNLYLNYPTVAENMTDGELPSAFPPAIPDANGNKLVDDAEFANIFATAKGSIKGGVIYSVPKGSTYAAGNLPASGNMASLSGSVSGNLILVGTAANPIMLDSNIAVDGDVIIKGVVKGSGQIYARGNLYVAGDVTYADGTDTAGNRTFGVAADGTKNALALTAGGNIMAGDYLTTQKGVGPLDTGDDATNSGKFSFAMSEITLFNRMEWTKTQAALPDSNGSLVANPLYLANYVPRYYTLGPGDPVYIYNKNDNKGKGTYFDAATKTWKGKEHISSYDMTLLTKISEAAAQASGAAVINLAPSNGWLTEQNLSNIWTEVESNRIAGEPFRIDGLMYTNNSLFNMSSKVSKTGGQMIVNGAIVASDLGILVPGNGGVGLQLNYDQRLKQFLKVKDSQTVTLVRQVWIIIR